MSLLGERNYDLLRSLFLVHNSKRKSPYIGLRFSDHEYSYSRSKAKHARARTRLFSRIKAVLERYRVVRKQGRIQATQVACGWAGAIVEVKTISAGAAR